MWGIIPAISAMSRSKPLAFARELLPVGSRVDAGVEQPRAVAEYLIERMIAGGATKICFVISPGRSDLLEYFGGRVAGADVVYVVQPRPAAGLCHALFRAQPLIRDDDHVLIGRPDTIWFPASGFAFLPDDALAFLLFPVGHPELFEAVVTDKEDRVREIQVRQRRPDSGWIWGAAKMSGAIFRTLHEMWGEPARGDEDLGSLVNAFLARGGRAHGIRGGEAYVDVGALNGYREAIRLLHERGAAPTAKFDPHAFRRPAAPAGAFHPADSPLSRD